MPGTYSTAVDPAEWLRQGLGCVGKKGMMHCALVLVEPPCLRLLNLHVARLSFPYCLFCATHRTR